MKKTNDDTFENLEVWQEAIDLAARVYELFRDCRDFGFRGQGYERDSNAELIRFLFIAKGSCGEVRSQTYVAGRVKLLTDANAALLISDAKRLSSASLKFHVRRAKFD